MAFALDINREGTRGSYSFDKLIQDNVGLVDQVISLRQEPASPPFELGVANLGNLAMLFQEHGAASSLINNDGSLGGAGSGVDPEMAWLRASVEAIERYCTIAHGPEDFIVASAADLGAEALDFSTIPRLSEGELADPDCPFVRPDPEARIRWARSCSLLDQRIVHIPSIMTHLYTQPWPSEQFWQPITTGVAAHTTLSAALVSAICEVIERDAIALTWLCRRRIPRIDVTGTGDELMKETLDRVDQGQMRHLLFDATTDVGIPTVYCLQLAEGHPHLSQIVNCATSFSAAAAAAKTMSEIAAARTAFQTVRETPPEIGDFTQLTDGAFHLGRPEMRDAFDFLLEVDCMRQLDELEIDAPGDDNGRLRYLLDRLADLEMDAYAVDLTTDEVREAGLWVVRVVIPGLLPMSSIQRARFLGHPRVSRYLGDPANGPVDSLVNPHPQPFA